MPARLLLYALGGGWGHLSRAFSLGRAAARRGHAVELLTNSPHAPRFDAAELGSHGRITALSSTLDAAAGARAVDARLAEARFDALVVDCFPRGIVGELVAPLAELSCPAILVHRDLSPDYIERFDLRRHAERFCCLLLPGEDAPLMDLPQARRTAPWLLRDHEELVTPREARRRLAARGEEPVVALLGAGEPHEALDAARAATRISEQLGDAANVVYVGARGPATPAAFEYWPFLELLPGVDLLIGAGGYNSVQEARATATPFAALPRRRLYDRQALRLRPRERLAVAKLDELSLDSPPPRRGPVPRYANGVEEALDHIEETLVTGAPRPMTKVHQGTPR